MTYVPTPIVVPHTPSYETRELANRLAKVITEFEQNHPTMSQGEVTEAARMAVQATRRGRGLDVSVAAAAAGLGVLMVGLLVFFFVGVDVTAVAGRYVVMAAIAFFGVIAALLALLRRGSL